MKKNFTVQLSRDFYILCDLFSLTPEEVLQHYVNNISTSVFTSKTIDEAMAVTTYFFGAYSGPKTINKR